MKEACKLIGYALVEAYNRGERVASVTKARTERDEAYHKRVGKYPSSTGNPFRIRRLDKQGKALSGTRRTAFKEPDNNTGPDNR